MISKILLTFVTIKIMHRKDNTFWTYCKKNGRTSQRIRLQKIKFKNYGKLIKKIKIMRNLQLKTDALPSESVSGKFKKEQKICNKTLYYG